jgi:hypothetical protein
METVLPLEDSIMVPKERFEAALRSSEPGAGLRAAITQLAAEGWKKDQLYQALEEYILCLRASKDRSSSEEDVVLDAMDALEGWCHPNAQLLP